MPKLPMKLFLFLAVAGFFYLYGLPRRAQFVSSLLRDRRERHAQDSAQDVVEAKIRGEMCRFEDACEYKPLSWEGFGRGDDGSVSIIHAFVTDGTRHKFLFRIREGSVSEIDDVQ